MNRPVRSEEALSTAAVPMAGIPKTGNHHPMARAKSRDGKEKGDILKLGQGNGWRGNKVLTSQSLIKAMDGEAATLNPNANRAQGGQAAERDKVLVHTYTTCLCII